jgi:hypothetical protein
MSESNNPPMDIFSSIRDAVLTKTGPGYGCLTKPKRQIAIEIDWYETGRCPLTAIPRPLENGSRADA